MKRLLCALRGHRQRTRKIQITGLSSTVGMCWCGEHQTFELFEGQYPVPRGAR